MKSVRIQILYAAVLALLLMSGLTMLCYEAYGLDVAPQGEEIPERVLKGDYCTEMPGYSLYQGCLPVEGIHAEPCWQSCPQQKGNFQEKYSNEVCGVPTYGEDREMICCCKG